MQENNYLSSPEISNLWTHYIRETLSVCVNKYMLQTIQDADIHNIFQLALQFSNKHIETLTKLFKQERFPIPKGFTEEDVNLEAPSLFTDVLCLKSLYMMSTHGHNEYSLAFTTSIREDIADFYYQCNLHSMELYKKAKDLLILKQLYQKPPSYLTPKKVKIIKEYSYVTDVFGKHRPMNSVESGNIYFNLNKAMIAKALILGFKQVSKNPSVRVLLEKSLQVKNKHIDIFSSLLTKDNLHLPKSCETEITNSTISPFSDRLILLQTGFLFGIAVTYYSAALIASMRADISAHCEKAALNSLWIYSRIGKDMIDNQWMEQPPQADDRKRL
ncbi:DUF3231 family protein [Priestia megaterium]|uniref:DUF3231 family protein n=1 Tax=Priestia megaterium TaxID=1404 RepID=UPI001C8E2F3E|nr:DUF3231 family protein [Priestia megaterium]MBY0200396.1 DUF3231 family protein [Priestia megaterium]